MKTRTKVIISIIAVVLSALLVTTIVLLSYGDEIRTANIRNMVLENKGIDVESTLSNFDNPTYKKEGNTVYFESSKKFDLKQDIKY